MPIIHPVLMAGGSGTRLWPMSRKLYPKQYLPLGGELGMLQESLWRLKGLPSEGSVLVCNEEHRLIKKVKRRPEKIRK